MLAKALARATAAAPKTYIEDVFSTWLYTGTGSTQTITNGIDLAGEGGLVWIKDRNGTNKPVLTDTDRGATYTLSTDRTDGEFVVAGIVSGFTASGFSIGTNGAVNSSSSNYASWTFRKAPGFFDVVTYTGNGVQGRAINHSLGSAPGCIIVKCTSAAYGWMVYHRSTGKDAYLVLSSTGASTTDNLRWNSTDPTSSQFTVGNAVSVNESGQTYVAYLFAHDEQIFGEGGDQSVIKCGSYTGNGSTTGPTISLGWEPQWLLIKRTDAAGENWFLVDSMRGLTVAGSDDEYLLANSSNAAFSTSFIAPLATGFQLNSTSGAFNASGGTYIYIAIRRGPMKTPTDATEVFKTSAVAVDTSIGANTSFPVDVAFDLARTAGGGKAVLSRLTGTQWLQTQSTGAEASGASVWYTYNNFFGPPGIFGASAVYELFRRAPGFFDVVAYTGTGVARTVNHNLGVAPELMICKSRNGAQGWIVYTQSTGNNYYLRLELTDAKNNAFDPWNSTSPTASVFSLGTSAPNSSANNYIAYLFATLPGISKVGSYTGTGTTLNIDCGFTSGARLVIIKRTDSTGNWYVWDTARGIVSGNDPYLLLNSTAAEVTSTDYIDPLSSGFQISSTAPAEINNSGGSYIFLAVA